MIWRASTFAAKAVPVWFLPTGHLVARGGELYPAAPFLPGFDGQVEDGGVRFGGDDAPEMVATVLWRGVESTVTWRRSRSPVTISTAPGDRVATSPGYMELVDGQGAWFLRIRLNGETGTWQCMVPNVQIWQEVAGLDLGPYAKGGTIQPHVFLFDAAFYPARPASDRVRDLQMADLITT